MTFFFTFVFMFMVFWRPQEWLVPWLFGYPVLDFVVVLSLFTLFIEIDSKKLRFPKEMPQFKLVLGMYIAVLMSHIAHTYLVGLMNAYEEPFKFCLFTVLLITVLDSPRKLRALAWLFVFMAGVMSIHLIMQERLGYGFTGLQPLHIGAIGSNPPYTRSLFFGIFGDPNEAGQFVVSAIPFGFLLFKRKSFFTFLIGCGLAWLFVRALSTTHSRGAEVGLVALVAMLIVMKLPQRWMPVLLPLGLIGALALCPLAGKSLDMSARERVVMWGFCNSYLIRHPVSLIFGLGYNMSYQIADIFNMHGMTMHNAFVYCYTEIGYFGFIFWFGLILAGIMGCWLVRLKLAVFKKQKNELAYIWRYAGLAICAMVAFSASGYFLSRAFVYPMLFLMAILGCVLRIGRETLESSPEFDEWGISEGEMDLPSNFWVFYPIAAGVGMIYVWISCRMLNLGV